MVNVFLCVLVVFLLAFIAWREHYHDRERQDLYNRIMAGDIAEYNAVSGVKKPKARPRSTIAAFRGRGNERLQQPDQEAGEQQ